MIPIPLDYDPFEKLDAYSDEAFVWSTKVLKRIERAIIKNLNPIEFPNGLESRLLSIAFVKIYDEFLHTSMSYSNASIEDYLREICAKENIEQEWNLMLKYVSLIYIKIKASLEGDYLVFMTLWQSVLMPSDDGEWIEPYNLDKDGAFQYVLNGFVV